MPLITFDQDIVRELADKAIEKLKHNHTIAVTIDVTDYALDKWEKVLMLNGLSHDYPDYSFRFTKANWGKSVVMRIRKIKV